jgi:hypothetical protein
MRRQITATVRTKVMDCRECGNPVTVGSNTRIAPRCIECGVTAQSNAIREMSEKSGPTYEKWQAAMIRAIARG